MPGRGAGTHQADKSLGGRDGSDSSAFCRDLHGDSHGWFLAQQGCLGTLQGTGQDIVPNLPCPGGTGTEGAGCLVLLQEEPELPHPSSRHSRAAALALLPPPFPSRPKPSLPVLLRSPKLFRSKACATPHCDP